MIKIKTEYVEIGIIKEDIVGIEFTEYAEAVKFYKECIEKRPNVSKPIITKIRGAGTFQREITDTTDIVGNSYRFTIDDKGVMRDHLGNVVEYEWTALPPICSSTHL